MTFQAKKEFKAAEAPAGFSPVGVERKDEGALSPKRSLLLPLSTTLTGLYP